MPFLERPDGARIHWQERGEGPLVVFAVQFFGYPEVFTDLIEDVAADHRVVLYDPRGMGESSAEGPYDAETDADDLGAVIEAAGGPALVIGMGDGVNRAVNLSAKRPELVSAILTPGGNPVGRTAAAGSDALVDSPAVLKALLGMIETDYRAALRTIVSSANPGMSEEDARERVDRIVAYCPAPAGVARLNAWIEKEPIDEAKALGDRLWMLVLVEADNPWFPNEGYRKTRELLPEVRLEEVANGPLSRPDLTAAVIRKITGSTREAGSRAASSS